MKLYTKRGDDGHTDLFGGKRVPKHHLRVAAYGDVDEANAAIGCVIADCKDQQTSARLVEIQSDLFCIGAVLAGADPNDSTAFDKKRIGVLEGWIDDVDGSLPVLRNFILPGGTRTAAQLHLARTTARRAERAIAALAAVESVDDAVLIYVNRLSDLLFAMARGVNQSADVKDVPWAPGS